MIKILFRCPWHEEKTPSCVYRIHKGADTAFCLGCGKSASGDEFCELMLRIGRGNELGNAMILESRKMKEVIQTKIKELAEVMGSLEDGPVLH